MRRKRKAPTPMTNPKAKRQLLDASEAILSLHDNGMPLYDVNIAAHMIIRLVPIYTTGVK